MRVALVVAALGFILLVAGVILGSLSGLKSVVVVDDTIRLIPEGFWASTMGVPDDAVDPRLKVRIMGEGAFEFKVRKTAVVYDRIVNGSLFETIPLPGPGDYIIGLENPTGAPVTVEAYIELQYTREYNLAPTLATIGLVLLIAGLVAYRLKG